MLMSSPIFMMLQDTEIKYKIHLSGAKNKINIYARGARCGIDNMSIIDFYTF